MKYAYLLALAVATAVASTSFSQTSIPITNSSFENPPVSSGNYTIYQFGSGTSNSVPGWTIASNGDLYDIQNPSTPFANQDGSQFMEDFSFSGANGGGTVYQILPTSFVPGTTYTLTAYATPAIAGYNSSQTGDYFFIANTSGRILAATTITAITSDDFVAFTVPFTSTGLLGDTGEIEIGFTSPSNFAQSDMEIDNFSLIATAVPEPGSIAMVALGGFILLGLLMRRTKQIRPHLLALAVVAVAASTSFSQTSIPIINPSFENPPVSSGGYTIYQFGSGTSNSVPGWTIASSGDIYDIQNPTTPFANQDGSQFLEDFSYADANGGGTVYQILSTSFVPGTNYTLTASATPDIHSPSSAQTGDYFFIANSSGRILAATTINATASRDFESFTVPFTSTGLLGDTGAIEIGFTSPINFAQSDMEIDNFALTATAVPEPGSIAMVALSSFGMLGFLRRQGGKMHGAGCRRTE